MYLIKIAVTLERSVFDNLCVCMRILRIREIIYFVSWMQQWAILHFKGQEEPWCRQQHKTSRPADEGQEGGEW
jgi:hypothetical protein